MIEVKEYGLDSYPFGELQRDQHHQRFITEALPLRKSSLKATVPASYLSLIETCLPQGLVSAQNYTEIKALASLFTSKITSFFGFESRLGTPEARADFLLAVSSRGGEREELLHFLNSDQAQRLFNRSEWRHLREFVAAWADPNSELYSNVLGLWLEFDTAHASQNNLVPCVFIHTIPLRMTSSEEERRCEWVFLNALPLLLGHPLSSCLQHRLFDALHKLPEGASVMDIGFMLSRTTDGARLVFKHLPPSHIIPYLESLGWLDTNHELACLINELRQQVTRLILHITITEEGVDPKIGLECSFSPDQYHLETRWPSFFEYLIRKGCCCKEKKTEALNFLGVSTDDPSHPFSTSSFSVAVRCPSEASAKALVRYISHVKLCCSPGKPPEAKVYPGVRLFSFQPEGGACDVQ